ncbi:MAG: peptidoglycan recognition protein family protein [Phycisphaerales bacterium]
MHEGTGHSPASPITRREALRAGAVFGLLGLSGCAATPDPKSALPGPVSPSPVILPPGPAALPTTATVSVQPRSAWTRVLGPTRSNANPMNGIDRITIHHEGSTLFDATDGAAVAKRIESIRLAHLSRRTKGEAWADIGYHYLVDAAGVVWEGRPLRYQGAHVEDFNEHNLGVVCLGNFDRQTPTADQANTLQRFIAEQMRRYGIASARVRTHRECPGAATRCPGENLQRTVSGFRSRGGVLG